MPTHFPVAFSSSFPVSQHLSHGSRLGFLSHIGGSISLIRSQNRQRLRGKLFGDLYTFDPIVSGNQNLSGSSNFKMQMKMNRQAVLALPIAVIFTVAAMHPSLKVCSTKDVGECSFSLFRAFLLSAAMVGHVYLLTRLPYQMITLPLITFYCLWFWVYIGHLTKDFQQLRCPFTRFVMSKPLALGMASAIFLLLLRPSRITAPCTVLCCIWLLVYLGLQV